MKLPDVPAKPAFAVWMEKEALEVAAEAPEVREMLPPVPSAAAPVGGWVGGWMGGWVDGWMGERREL